MGLGGGCEEGGVRPVEGYVYPGFYMYHHRAFYRGFFGI